MVLMFKYVGLPTKVPLKAHACIRLAPSMTCYFRFLTLPLVSGLLMSDAAFDVRFACMPTTKPLRAISCIRFAPNGMWIAVGSQDGSVRTFHTVDLAMDAPSSVHCKGLFGAITHSKKSFLASCEDTRTLWVWLWARFRVCTAWVSLVLSCISGRSKHFGYVYARISECEIQEHI